MARILVVEDDRTSARLLGALLKKGSHECVTAHSLDDAERVIQDDGDFDLMILDNQLHNRLGWELLESLRTHFYFKNLPVVVYTAAGDRDSVAKYVKLSVQNIRTKPYSWDVLRTEIEKALSSEWRAKDIESESSVRQRLGIDRDDYHEGLSEIEEQLEKASEDLLGLLSPAKKGQFIAVLSGLRSNSTNYGLPLVARTSSEIIAAFNEGDWSRSVKSIRMFKILAGWLSKRRQAESDEPSTLEPISLSIDDVSVDSVVQGEVSVELANEVSPAFRDLALNIAQGDVVRQLVSKTVGGSLPVSEWQAKIEVIGNSIRWLSFLEPSDSEVVATAIEKELPEVRDALLSISALDAQTGHDRPLRDIVTEVGVYPSAMIFVTGKWMSQLQRAGFPIKMESLAIRQLTVSGIIRRLASKIKRPINFEAVVCMEFLGEWTFALKYPGVYAMCLLESTDNAVRKHAAAFSKARQPILSKLNLPEFCRTVAESADMTKVGNTGNARLAVGLMSLADIIIGGQHDRESGHGMEAARKRFVESPAWGLLAGQSLKLPEDRNRFFDTLIDWVPVLEKRAGLIRLELPVATSQV